MQSSVWYVLFVYDFALSLHVTVVIVLFQVLAGSSYIISEVKNFTHDSFRMENKIERLENELRTILIEFESKKSKLNRTNGRIYLTFANLTCKKTEALLMVSAGLLSRVHIIALYVLLH